MIDSKLIAQLGHKLSIIDTQIGLINGKYSTLPFRHISIYNGSIENHELPIDDDMNEPLKDFLLDFYKKKKQDICDQIAKELRRPDVTFMP